MPRSVVQAAGWFGSRVGTGVLGLVQVVLATRALGSEEAAQFFLLWTAAWLLTVVLKFGADQVLPRAVAEALLTGHAAPSLRRVLGFGGLAALVATPAVFAAVGLRAGATAIGLALGLAVVWTGTLLCAGLLQAHDHPARSGLVANILWPLGPAAATALVPNGASWEHLGAQALLCSGLCLELGLVIAVRTLGLGAIRSLLSRRGPALPLESDTVGAAVLSFLWQAIVWLPVFFAALVGATATETAAIFAATRIAGLFSWAYSAVVAVITPRLASALASKDTETARRLLVIGSRRGLLVSLVPCVAGAILARPMLELVDDDYGVAATALSIIILTRLLDAFTGPVGEALFVGRRTWLDSAIVGPSLVVGGAVAVSVHPELGLTAIGVGVAAALALINVARLGVSSRLLRHGWAPGTGFPRAFFAGAGWTLLVGGGALAFLVERSAGTQAAWAWAAIGASAAVVVGATLVATTLAGRRLVLASPFGVVLLVTATEFTLRPLTLMARPESATWGLALIGFPWRAVAQAAAIGAATMAAFSLGFLTVQSLRKDSMERGPQPPHDGTGMPSPRRMARGTIAASALGTALWGTFFVHRGGLHALTTDPTQLHLDHFGVPYGIFGLMLCCGTLAVAITQWRQGRARELRLAVAVAGASSLAGSIALATRGPLVATGLALLVLAIRAARPTRRTVTIGALIVGLLLPPLLVGRAVRGYTQVQPAGEAVGSVLRTNPLDLVTADFIEFDHLVALRQVVPDDLGWLRGASLNQLGSNFIPRKLWSEKPLPLDYQVSATLYGPAAAAGTPFTLSGEMWWNFGTAGAMLRLLLLGALVGGIWQLLRPWRPGLPELLGALGAGYSYLILTRPLGAMAIQTTTALAALALAWLLATRAVRLPRVRLRHPDTGPRTVDLKNYALGDPLRGLFCLAVVVGHTGTQVLAVRGISPTAITISPDHLGPLMWFGALGVGGVWLFFSLSSYLLGLPFVSALIEGRPLPSARRYLRRRAFRILPPFYVVVIATMVFVGTAGANWHEILAIFLMAQNQDWSDLAGAVGHAWTLQLEVAFYLALPLLAWLMARTIGPRGTRATRAAIIIGVTIVLMTGSVTCWVLTAENRSIAWFLPARMFSVGPGIILATLHVLHRGALRPGIVRVISPPLVIAALLAMEAAALVPPRDWLSPLMRGMMLVFASFVVIGLPIALARAGRPTWRALDNRFFRWVGERSYSLYLVHALVILQCGQLLKLSDSLAMAHLTGAIVAVPLCLVAAGLLYRFVEHPWMVRRELPGRFRLLRRRRSDPAPAPAPTIPVLAEA